MTNTTPTLPAVAVPGRAAIDLAIWCPHRRRLSRADRRRFETRRRVGAMSPKSPKQSEPDRFVPAEESEKVRESIRLGLSDCPRTRHSRNGNE